MNPSAETRLLRALLLLIGLTATVTGLVSVIGGADVIPGADQASANVESELRFFSAFWVAFGAMALWAAARAESEPVVVRGLALALLTGGVARGIGWLAVGRPDPIFVVLMCLELLLAPVLVILQRRVGGQR